MEGIISAINFLKSLKAESITVNKPARWIFIFALFVSLNSMADRHSYINVYSPSSFFIIDDENLFSINDVQKDARFCKKDDIYFCVVSTGFSFYVPKSMLSIGKEWKVSDKVYKVTEQFRDGLGGFSGMVYIIEQQEKGSTLKFLYSRKSGLIGFGGVTKNSSAFFMVTGVCGFAHDEYCQTRNK